jgi:N utilization substance protein B
MAVQMLFQSDLGGSPLPQIFNSFDPAAQPDEQQKRAAGGHLAAAYDYGKALVTGTLEHRDEIDELIREQAEHWRLERMPVVDRNILRLAIYEFLYETDVPKLVVLDEAIELAKRFGSEQSSKFVNGLLDGLLKRHQFPGRMK